MELSFSFFFSFFFYPKPSLIQIIGIIFQFLFFYGELKILITHQKKKMLNLKTLLITSLLMNGYLMTNCPVKLRSTSKDYDVVGRFNKMRAYIDNV